MPDSDIPFLAQKVFVHRWPHDPPNWEDSTKDNIDESINKNSEKKKVVIKQKTIKIQDIEFHSLKKIGISVPFFNDEFRMIFESQFGKFYAHVHITMTENNYLDVFNQLISWRKTNFSN